MDIVPNLVTYRLGGRLLCKNNPMRYSVARLNLPFAATRPSDGDAAGGREEPGLGMGAGERFVTMSDPNMTCGALRAQVGRSGGWGMKTAFSSRSRKPSSWSASVCLTHDDMLEGEAEDRQDPQALSTQGARRHGVLRPTSRRGIR